MPTTYNWLKVIHVLSVISWFGGAIALRMLTVRISATESRDTLAGYLRSADHYAPRFLGGGSALVLLSGIAMVIVGHIGFKTPWVGIGFAGIVIHIFVGAWQLPKTANALEKLASAAGTTDAQLAAGRSRFVTVSTIYLIMLAVIVADMVVKPTF
jgi:uncharacterized membrane protein